MPLEFVPALTAAAPCSSCLLRSTSAATASRRSSAERVEQAIGACGAAGGSGAALLAPVLGGEELSLLLLVGLSGVGLLEELLTTFLLCLRLGLVI